MPKYSIPVWQMIVSALEKHSTPGKYVTLEEIRKRVQTLYPNENVNKMTIRLQTIFHCVNHPGRRNDVSKRWERNPLFFSNGKDSFRLLDEKEKRQYKKTP